MSNYSSEVNNKPKIYRCDGLWACTGYVPAYDSDGIFMFSYRSTKYGNTIGEAYEKWKEFFVQRK